MVAEDRIQTHAQRRAELVIMLKIPAKSVDTEAMEQRDETTVPVISSKVHGINAGLG